MAESSASVGSSLDRAAIQFVAETKAAASKVASSTSPTVPPDVLAAMEKTHDGHTKICRTWDNRINYIERKQKMTPDKVTAEEREELALSWTGTRRCVAFAIVAPASFRLIIAWRPMRSMLPGHT